MSKIKKGLIGILIIAIIAILLLYPKLKRLNHIIHLFDEDRIVENFRSFDKIMDVSQLTPSPNLYTYPLGETIDLPNTFIHQGTKISTEDFIKDSRTTGLLVIQDGNIVYEKYYLGNTKDTKNISWSMAKSFISALVGIAVKEGHIKSIEQTADEYCPILKGSGYEGITIKNILQMSTGVKFDEDYGDFNSDINRWGRGFAWGSSQDKFAATLVNDHPQGTFNNYVSINTHVLGMILTKATGRSVTEYMQEKFWNPIGAEHNAYWIVDDQKMEAVLGGFNATVRDFAKIGSLYLNKGRFNGKQIVPEKWVRESVTPDAPHLKPGKNEHSSRLLGYGYQWWIVDGDMGEFMAQGVYNQNIYVNPVTNTVIVKLSANDKYNDKSYTPSLSSTAVAFFRAIAESQKVRPEVKIIEFETEINE